MRILIEDFKFGGKTVFVPYNKKTYMAFHMDEVKEDMNEDYVMKHGTFMGYISKEAAESGHDIK